MENEKKERKKKLISRKLETDLKVSGSTGGGRRLSERRGNRAARRRERKRGPPIAPTCRLGPPRTSGNDEIRTPGGTGCPLSEFQVRFPIAPRLFRAGAPRGAFFPISRPSETP
ncbi:hypothetical protein TNCT_18771 [Trichonephila clavata]|uniref:Uncharacterized protein n=1 Tax=Trichonephila clavata TaxID=2740835 RepID=A0A8X6KJC2_TRICU|nr:hypothetical protein TNCT_214591 [Trichonephila clavata]GFQ77483.1 hypothetical protein TNCT_18771 [Trichonephila clavata]